MRYGNHEVQFPENHWEAWVSEGRVPPGALIHSPRMTGGLWRRADSLELYDFFRRSGEEDRREAIAPPDPRPPFADLPEDWKCPNCGAGKKMFRPLAGPGSTVEEGI